MVDFGKYLVRSLFAILLTLPALFDAHSQDTRWTMQDDRLGAIVDAMSMSPDGMYGAVAFNDKAVQLYRLSTNSTKQDFEFSSRATALAFDEQALYVLDQTAGAFSIDLTTGQKSFKFGVGSPGPWLEVANGALAVVGTDASLRVYSTEGELQFEEMGVTSRSCDFSADGNLVVYSVANKIRVYNVQTKQVSSYANDLSFPVMQIRFVDASNKVVFRQAEVGLRVLDLTTKQIATTFSYSVSTFKGHISSDGRIAMLGEGSTLSFIQPSDGSLLRATSFPTTTHLWASSKNGDHSLVAMTGSLDIVGSEFERKYSLWGHSQRVTSVDLTPNGDYAITTSAADGIMKTWNAVAGLLTSITQLSLHSTAHPISYNDRFIVPLQGDVIHVYGLDGTFVKNIDLNHESALVSITKEDETILVGYADGKLLRLNATTFEEVKTWSLPIAPTITAVHGGTFVGVQGNTIIVYDLDEGTQKEMYSSPFFLRSISFSPDGQFFIVGADQGTHLYSLSDQSLNRILPVGGVASFIGDSTIVAIQLLGDSIMYQLNLSNPTKVLDKKVLIGQATAVKFGPSNQAIVGTYEGRIQLLESAELSVRGKKQIPSITHVGGAELKIRLEDGVEYWIYDVTGRVVNSDRITGEFLTLNQGLLTPGVYHIIIGTLDGYDEYKLLLK